VLAVNAHIDRDGLRFRICKARLGLEEEVFCQSHQAALNNVRQHCQQWLKAYGALVKRNYLQSLAANGSSGEWVIEVAEYLLREGAEGGF